MDFKANQRNIAEKDTSCGVLYTFQKCPTYQTAFKKDYKRIVKRGYDTKRLERVIGMLAAQQELPPEYKDHSLIGDYKGCRECHIAPDWLLVYEVVEHELLLYLTRTGTHSDLF